ncbi:MAG: penicillin-binding protein 2 [Sulfurovum sp.]|nr:penicillin-binding protein 2 [Sulfurovum sp.]
MRYRLIILIFILFWIGMIGRLYHVSIKSNFYYEELAKENIERKQFIKPVRGEISDINGQLLAMNQIGFSVSIQPHLKSTSQKLNTIIDRLVVKFPDLNKSIMLKVYKKFNSPYNHNYIKVVDFIHYAQMMSEYSELSLHKELKIDAETKRYYPYGKYIAHIVGYTGRSNAKENANDKVVNTVGSIGKTGLEKYYNEVLKGDLGYQVSKVNARNKAIDMIEKKLPVDNKNLQLNIDIDLQQIIYERFKEANQTGVVVVMRTNGEILSAVSYPAYDPNLFVGGISQKDWKALQDDVDKPFSNKIIHGTYPPGSTIKMGMALAFSNSLEGVLDTKEVCNGHITLGRSKHKFRCWSRWGHGKVRLRKSIRESCDVYYYNKSLKVGIDAMAKHLRSFGLGVKTGVDLPREYNGIIPDKQWKMKRYKQPWYMGETVISAIGQGYTSVTPLQVARYTVLMATSKLVTPHVARVIDGKHTPRMIKHIPFNKKHLSDVQLGMYDVCNVRGGTGYRTMHKLPIKVAGKTGTSQVTSIPQSTKVRLKEHELAYYHRSHAWITTYAPYDDPKYVVTVLVEHGGHGGSTAGPIAADIYKWLYKNNYFPRIKEKKKSKLKMNITQK